MSTLIKFNKNWADEFDCEEFIIIHEPIQDVQELLNKFLSEKHEISFGSNQSFYNFFTHDFELQEIDANSSHTLEKFLAQCFGTGVLKSIFFDKNWMTNY